MIDPGSPDYDNTPASHLRPLFNYAPKFDSRPLVSIVTPYFNTGHVFQETVVSIQRMSVPNWEWIIVDDGSTDSNSIAQLKKLEDSEPRVRVLRQANQGPSAARNRAAKEACSPYLLQVDADDMVEPTFVEKSIWLLETQPQFDVAGSFNVTFGVEQRLWQNGFQQYKTALTKENMMTNLAVIRRSAYLASGGHDETISKGHEDWDLWLNLAEVGSWGYTIPEFLTWYRKSSGTRSFTTNNSKEQLQAFHQWIMTKHDGLASRFKAPRFPKLIENEYPTVPHESVMQNALAKPLGIKRILMILPWLEIGGADKFNLDLVRTLSQRGYEFTLATTIDSLDPWLSQFSQVTPDIFCLHNFLNMIDYPRFLNYLIDSRQVDAVIISNTEMGYLLAPYLRAHHPKLAILDYAHCEEEQWKNGGYPGMSLRAGQQLDLHVTSTEYLKRWMTTRGGNADTIRVAHTNIDVEDWTPDSYNISAAKEDLGIEADTPIILFVGRVVSQKRPLVWIEIIKRLAAENPNFVALVLGDGSLITEMRMFAQKHRIRQVRFLGAQRNEQVRKIMAASDILLLPSQYEGLALVLFECMAMEMVPVATSFGGHPELVTSECGYLIDSGPDEISEYVEHLHKLLDNPALRRKMKMYGRERVAKYFALANMGNDMERYIQEAERLASLRETCAGASSIGDWAVSQAMEYVRLAQVSDELWAKLNDEKRLIHSHGRPPKSPVEFVRYTRELVLPLGSGRYEVYKRWRRRMFPSAYYMDL